MRLRSQLILTTFLLAVVPLAAIVVYSHHSSRQALESAYRREAIRLTAQMDRRLAAIRADLDQRLAVVSALPINAQTAKHGDEQQAAVAPILTAMGDVATLVDSLEFQPLPRHDPRTRTTVAQEEEAEPEVAETPETPVTPQVASVEPAAAPAPPAPIVINIPPPPQFPRYRSSPEERELVAKISMLASNLARGEDLPPEERRSMERELNAAQEKLSAVLESRQAEFRQLVEVAQQQQQERERILADARRQRELDRAQRPKKEETRRIVVAADHELPAEVRRKVAEQLQKNKDREKQIALILGSGVKAQVKKQGEVVGQVTAQVNPEEVIKRILGAATDDSGEMPFALDREGNLYTRNDDDRRMIEALGVKQRIQSGRSLKDIDGWIVTATTDAQSGLRIGVARRVGENFEELKRTAARNFALGLGLVAFALIGIVPFANHLTRDVKLVADGAERLAHGDLMTRLPVKSKNEFGQLAQAFNRMAEDLSVHQQKLLEQERARKEQELQQRLLAVDNERKTVELEEARRFQLSLLPKEVPQHERYDIAVFTQTATEVGGDYYDFHVSNDGVLSVTIGDATGHGAKAGTMVTVIKTLFSAYSGTTAPAEFLGDAAEKIKRMELGRMSMALSLARFDDDALTLATAGMPPVLVHRAASGEVEELSHGATPLGTLGITYAETRAPLATGDTILFMTDGLPELLNDAGQQFGYAAAIETFAAAAKAVDADGVIASLADVTSRWHGDQPPNDDVTFVVVRVA